MARRVDDTGTPIPMGTCQEHGEFYRDSDDATCPTCEDTLEDEED